MKVKSLSRVGLSDPMACSPPGSSVRGIFQAGALEWEPLPSPLLSLVGSNIIITLVPNEYHFPFPSLHVLKYDHSFSKRCFSDNH